MTQKSDDLNLISYATVRQLEILDMLGKGEANDDIAHKLGISVDTVTRSMRLLRAKAAAKGNAPGVFDHGTLPGYNMGKVTIHRDADGVVKNTWERQHPDDVMREQMLREFAETLAVGVKGLARPMKQVKAGTDELMAVIPIGDPHFGMRAWFEDAGADFDLEIAERHTCAAIDRLVDTGPNCETALLLNLGDHFHADNQRNQTQSGHQLDVDGRWAQVQQVGLRSMIYAVDRLRSKYSKVVVRINRGNHDGHSAYALAMMLKCYYHNEAGVEIDISPAMHWYMQFGKVLIGSTHGDTTKGADLMPVMAADRPVEWGTTRHRYWMVGHVHHKFAKEYPGGIVEYFRTLAAGDAWHRGQGYRSGRDMNLVVMHKEHGEVERHRCDIGMLV